MRGIHATVGAVALVLSWPVVTSAATAGQLADDFWLVGNYTQNAPCKGDGSDPAERKVKISTQQIDSKVGVCTFLDARPAGKTLNAHLECQLPAGLLMSDVTFTQRANDTIDFIDGNKNYTATLYRCPK
jgi:hypothetical protein